MVKIAHASISENNTVNGKEGDQTKREVCIRDWYSKPWTYVIRFKDPDMREKCAWAMEAACANDKIGYSQGGKVDRNSLLKEARKVGYDPSKVNKLCNTDCSALITLAAIYAGIAESVLVVSGNSATTRTLKKRLEKTGEVEVFTDKEHTQKSDKLLRGDILLAYGKHVVCVVSGSVYDKKDRTIEDVARAVIRGEYGNNPGRKKRIIEEGYDYELVRQKVNELLEKK